MHKILKVIGKGIPFQRPSSQPVGCAGHHLQLTFKGLHYKAHFSKSGQVM